MVKLLQLTLRCSEGSVSLISWTLDLFLIVFLCREIFWWLDCAWLGWLSQWGARVAYCVDYWELPTTMDQSPCSYVVLQPLVTLRLIPSLDQCDPHSEHWPAQSIDNGMHWFSGSMSKWMEGLKKRQEMFCILFEQVYTCLLCLQEHVKRLTTVDMEVISGTGAPTGEKHVVCWLPPLNKEKQQRNTYREAAKIVVWPSDLQFLLPLLCCLSVLRILVCARVI
jgi:hypothetical protein